MSHLIETERLRLRPIEVRDLNQIHRMWADPLVRRYLWDDLVITKERARQEIVSSTESFTNNDFGLWVVLPKERKPAEPGGKEQLIGFRGLRLIDGSSDAELLYGLHPAYWGKGYATEASSAVLRRFFAICHFDRVLARTDVPNITSVRVIERLGMDLIERSILNGIDTLIYEVSRERFLKTHTKQT